jgi:hypothetical protein
MTIVQFLLSVFCFFSGDSTATVAKPVSILALVVHIRVSVAQCWDENDFLIIVTVGHGLFVVEVTCLQYACTTHKMTSEWTGVYTVDKGECLKIPLPKIRKSVWTEHNAVLVAFL